MYVRQRNIAVCIILCIVTCGIYGIYWFVTVTDEVREVTKENGSSGILALILTFVTCGLYGFFWAYQIGEALDRSRARNNVPPGSLALIMLLCSLFSMFIVPLAIAQNELNNYTPVA